MMLVWLLIFGAYSQNTTCYNCNAKPCKHFGECISGACQCPDGFGGIDCGTPLCGSIAISPEARPLKSEEPCSCRSGLTGPNCNICQNDGVCSNVPGKPIGASYICNQKSIPTHKKHFSYCSIQNPTISMLFPGNMGISVESNGVNKSSLGTIWLDNQAQFSCIATQCSFSSKDNTTKSDCSAVSCSCIPGTSFCGNGGFFDLTGAVNSASGNINWVCGTNNTCTLNFEFLSSILPDGIALEGCSFGECVDKDLTPDLSENDLNKMDPAGIAGISILSTIFFTIAVLIGLGVWERKNKKSQEKQTLNHGVQVSFSNVYYDINGKSILRGISATANPGSLMGILGPSGAGKSSLLDILAGKRMTGKVRGNFSLYQGRMDFFSSIRRISGYVAQEDVFFPTLTVREVLEFSATLRLPESMTKEEKKDRVDSVLSMLSLSHVADSQVGDEYKRGISGGEKRRLSIGVELVTDPSVLYLDEPTSGLDAYNASQVVKVLSKLAKETHKTIICTIHQPRSDIFALFDDLLLLSLGETIYSGRVDQCAEYVAAIGAPCPLGYNMADHLLDIASNQIKINVTESTRTLANRFSPSGILPPAESIESLTAIEQEHRKLLAIEFGGKEIVDASNFMVRTSYLTQLEAVFLRQWRHFYRRPMLFLAHLGAAAFLGVFLGGLYWKADSSLGGIQNRLGSMFFIQSLLAFSSLSAIASLSEDRVIFMRERSNNFYGSSPFFIVKIVFDLIPLRIIPAFIMGTIAYTMIGYTSGSQYFWRFTAIMIIFSCNCGLFCLMIGTATRNFGTGTLIASISILFQMLFAGILVNQVQIPNGLRWIPWLSTFKYAYEAVVVNDASSLKFVDKISGVDVTVGASVILSKFGIDINAYWRDFAVSLGIFILLHIIIALLFRFRLKERR